MSRISAEYPWISHTFGIFWGGTSQLRKWWPIIFSSCWQDSARVRPLGARWISQVLPSTWVGSKRSQRFREKSLMWIKQCHLHHPPVITIFTGAMGTIPCHGWFMIVLPTWPELVDCILRVWRWVGLLWCPSDPPVSGCICISWFGQKWCGSLSHTAFDRKQEHPKAQNKSPGTKSRTDGLSHRVKHQTVKTTSFDSSLHIRFFGSIESTGPCVQCHPCSSQNHGYLTSTCTCSDLVQILLPVPRNQTHKEVTFLLTLRLRLPLQIEHLTQAEHRFQTSKSWILAYFSTWKFYNVTHWFPASLPTCRAKKLSYLGNGSYENLWNHVKPIPQLGEMKPHKSLFWVSTQGYLWHAAIYLPLKDLHLPGLAFQSHPGFPSMGVPQARWMIYNGKSICKWMIWGTPILGNLQMVYGCLWQLKTTWRKTGSLCSTEPLLLRQPPEDVDLNNKQGIQAIWGRKDLIFFIAKKGTKWGPQKTRLSEQWTSRNPMVGHLCHSMAMLGTSIFRHPWCRWANFCCPTQYIKHLTTSAEWNGRRYPFTFCGSCWYPHLYCLFFPILG